MSENKNISFMSETELKLLSMIRENDNPGRAFVKAIEIIIKYLEQLESFEEQAPVCSQALF